MSEWQKSGELPRKIVYEASPLKHIITCIFCLVLYLVLIYFLRKNGIIAVEILLWIGIIATVVCSIYALINVLVPSKLTLNLEGFEKRSAFATRKFKWSNIFDIQTTKSKLATQLAINNTSENLITFTDGFETPAVLKNVYGENIREITEAMNQFRDRALQQESGYSTDDNRSTAAATSVKSNSDWKSPSEREAFALREERAPIGRWIVGIIILGLVIAGALWLASKVVVPRDISNQPPKSQTAEPEAPKIGADDAAWVRALEKDTLEGYREYLEAFPDGKHADAAQAEIDAYDNRDWATAEGRNTIAGYEDYLAAWPEGLHASKAQERINEMKAAAEAARKDAAERAEAARREAAERALREARDWQTAAQANSVQSYQQYLSQHPGGPNAPEAQTRIDRMQATAAETAAWNAAKSANTAGAYQSYLSSYPQGSYAAQAIAAIEALRPSPGRTFRDCVDCPDMVSLPSGTASLGAADTEADARPNEKPQRPVTFANLFAISVTEVTFAEYDACIAAGGCSGRPNDNGWGRGNRPVINVSWDDAQKYTAWLSSKSGHSYSLPTEAQWEYAARAGDSNALLGGSPAAICAFANGAGAESGLKWANAACSDPVADRTMPAGRLGANKFGVKDAIGNVAEWTQDCNTLNLRDAPTDGSADSRGSCNQRVVRGGSWFSGPADMRYASRLMQRRGDSNDFTGFRVVRKVGG